MNTPTSYRIESDVAKWLIRVTISGFWDKATADEFARDLGLAIQSLTRAGGRPGEYLYLADSRASAIFPAEMAERFRELAGSLTAPARRIAVVGGSTLQKMQSQRIVAAYDHLRFFSADESAEAEAWLLTGTSPAS